MTSRPTIMRLISCSLRPARSAVPMVRPRRSTVTRSQSSLTSFSLWEMKMMVCPDSFIFFSSTKSSAVSCGVSTAVGSSKISTLALR